MNGRELPPAREHSPLDLQRVEELGSFTSSNTQLLEHLKVIVYDQSRAIRKSWNLKQTVVLPSTTYCFQHKCVEIYIHYSIFCIRLMLIFHTCVGTSQWKRLGLQNQHRCESYASTHLCVSMDCSKPEFVKSFYVTARNSSVWQQTTSGGESRRLATSKRTFDQERRRSR